MGFKWIHCCEALRRSQKTKNPGVNRGFVKFNVAAERQPLAELAMMDEQDLVVVDDEDRDGEINFFVDVGHALPAEINSFLSKDVAIHIPAGTLLNDKNEAHTHLQLNLHSIVGVNLNHSTQNWFRSPDCESSH